MNEKKKFKNCFEIIVPDDNCFFYSDWETLQRAVIARRPKEYFFNPFMRQLERYPSVPLTERKKILSALTTKTVLFEDDDWRCLASSESLESAYLKGSGVVVIREQSNELSYHSIRLLSLKEKIVDRVFPDQFAFNLYTNSCQHCHGYGKILSYPLGEWIDETKSILDKGSLPFPLENSLPKRTISHFATKEGLFDFRKKIHQLSKVERDILFYGFKAYRFRKASAKSNADHQYYEWEGLNSYIYDKRKQLEANALFIDKVDWVVCPFCTHGFSSSISFYQCEGEIFTDIF
ncbi:hypothetical protein [Pseudoalteromonas sp. SaAl2]